MTDISAGRVARLYGELVRDSDGALCDEVLKVNGNWIARWYSESGCGDECVPDLLTGIASEPASGGHGPSGRDCEDARSQKTGVFHELVRRARERGLL